LWISGTVREKNTIRFFCENGLSGSIRRHNSYSCIMLGEQAKNVALDPEIVGDDVALRFRIAPRIALFGRDARCEIEPFHRGTCVERRESFGTGSFTCGNYAPHDSDRPQMPRETTRINFLQDGHIGLG